MPFNILVERSYQFRQTMRGGSLTAVYLLSDVLVGGIEVEKGELKRIGADDDGGLLGEGIERPRRYTKIREQRYQTKW